MIDTLQSTEISTVPVCLRTREGKSSQDRLLLSASAKGNNIITSLLENTLIIIKSDAISSIISTFFRPRCAMGVDKGSRIN